MTTITVPNTDHRLIGSFHELHHFSKIGITFVCAMFISDLTYNLPFLKKSPSDTSYTEVPQMGCVPFLLRNWVVFHNLLLMTQKSVVILLHTTSLSIVNRFEESKKKFLFCKMCLYTFLHFGFHTNMETCHAWETTLLICEPSFYKQVSGMLPKFITSEENIICWINSSYLRNMSIMFF